MMFPTIARVVTIAVVVATIGFASPQAPEAVPGDPAVLLGPLEVPDDPYVLVRREDLPRTPAARPTRNGYVSVQVNVDANGENIVGDAANEPSIAVDPTNPNLMAIGWRQFDTIASDFRQAGWGYTTDAGSSWTFPGVIEPGVFRSDPVLDFDTEGNFYYNSLTLAGSDYLCRVFKSTDGGMTWDEGVDAYGGDKQWMTIDRTEGVGQNNIYAYWTEYYSSCDGQFTRSYDGGESFVDCTSIPSSPQWGTLAVGPDGELYVCGDGFTVAKSTTMQNPFTPAQWDFSTSVDLDGALEYGTGPNPGGLLGQAWIAVDHSDGPTHGNVYLLASVDRYSTSDPLDVMFARSTDGGSTWSDPVRVNQDLTDSAYQWFGTMSVAPNGRIDVIWLDTRNDPGGYDSELFYSFSTDAGVTWSPEDVASPSFDPHVGWPQQQKMGDYFDMVSDEVGADLAYAATFNGEQDVYYLRIGDPACPDAGRVTLDRPTYACESTATITVLDCGLNTDDELTETVEVTIDSTTEPAGETVLLTETGPATAQFEGSIDLSTTDQSGVLWVTEGDTVTATYIDADDGQGGIDVEVTETAVVDCTWPIISNVQTTDIGPFEAYVTFETNEPALGSVRYGASCSALTETASQGGYRTEHSIHLTGLSEGATYFYAVDAEDEAGNLTTDDNGGVCYTFDTLDVPSYFTEVFVSGNDLDGLSLIFTPDESTDFYDGCVEEITELPTDPTDGTVLTMSSGDTFATVTLTGGATVSLYGVGYGTLYAGSNGYLTFNSGDSAWTETLGAHFQQPRISALFDDLNPSSSGGGSVSWKQLSDRVAVTWENVPEHLATGSNTFQIEMYFDGMIVVSYLGITATDGLAGLSAGGGLPPDFYQTDLSAMGFCAAVTIELPDGAPWRVDPDVPTTFAVLIEDAGEIVVPGSETLHYRFDPGAPEFLTSTLTPLGDNLYEATLPAASCSDQPEFYFSATGDGGTTVYEPVDAPTSVYSAVVAILTVILDDDFETDLGWTVENIELEGGAWERGIPAGDGSRGDPTTDFDGSGQCYLTDNQAGNSDVDGGPTRLISPIIDLSATMGPVLRYARWFTNDDQDEDRLNVEISDDDGGSWHLIETVPDTPGWVYRTFDVADYIELTDQVRVRFSATDNPNNSITEGGIDAVWISDLACFEPGNGDFDGDSDVDLDDLGAFQGCFAQSAVGDCVPANLMGGPTIDLADFAAFYAVFGGPAEP